MALGIFTGSPAFAEPLHVGRPNVGSRQRFFELLNGVLDRCWLTNNGPLVNEFESKIKEYVGVKHCISICNATIALEIVIRAAGLKGEVIVPSFTFVATAHALQWQYITPIFCDIDPVTHNIDPAKVEALITSRTTGIIAVHLWGRPCNVEALADIAGRRKLALIYDAAHGFGCGHKGRKLGGFGDAEVFSFHATKFFNTFEGGAVVTNDSQLADRVRLMRNFGFCGYDNVVHVGTNGKMPEVSAAMGLAGFERLDKFIQTNRRNFQAYQKHLSGVAGLKLVTYNEHEPANYHYIVVEVDERLAGLHRDELVKVLYAENVLARRYFWPGCHRMQPYKGLFPNAGLLLPVTEAIADQVLVLPNGTAVTPEKVETICNIIRAAVEQSAHIRAALRPDA